MASKLIEYSSEARNKLINQNHLIIFCQFVTTGFDDVAIFDPRDGFGSGIPIYASIQWIGQDAVHRMVSRDTPMELKAFADVTNRQFKLILLIPDGYLSDAA